MAASTLLPEALSSWLSERGSNGTIVDEATVPGGHGRRPFALATVRLSSLHFFDHSYNPRTPNPQKVSHLASSIRHLSLLSPLTCFFRDHGSEHVVLVDGRHRYNALRVLADEDPRWAREVRVDLKIYWQMAPSDVHVLATYLNRTRQNLRKGEYYRAVVHIYDKKKAELRAALGRLPTEDEIFGSVNARELPDRTFALSIGRLVALAALGDTPWSPYVGEHQNQRISSAAQAAYAPLTAGNLATFLSYLCNPRPHPGKSDARDIELANALKLGVIFRAYILRPVAGRDKATMTSLACKHWCLAALGSLMADSELLGRESAESLFSSPRVNWRLLEKTVRAYSAIMAGQADIVNAYRKAEDEKILRRAWSYQTQRDQVKAPLARALAKRGVRL